MLDALPSDSSTTRLSECLHACDSAQMGSAERLSQGAHELSSFRLGVLGRLSLGVVLTPKSTPRPECLMTGRLISLPLDYLSVCMPVTVHRWAFRKGLAWVHTNCLTSPGRAWGACESASSLHPRRLPGYITRQYACLPACDSAQTGSAAGLSPTVKLSPGRAWAPVALCRQGTQADSPAAV